MENISCSIHKYVKNVIVIVDQFLIVSNNSGQKRCFCLAKRWTTNIWFLFFLWNWKNQVLSFFNCHHGHRNSIYRQNFSVSSWTEVLGFSWIKSLRTLILKKEVLPRLSSWLKFPSQHFLNQHHTVHSIWLPLFQYFIVSGWLDCTLTEFCSESEIMWKADWIILK